MSWKVLYYNINSNRIEELDVLKYKTEQIKQLKKLSSRVDFDIRLRELMMYQYWSRSEYELILEKVETELYVKPWVGCRNPEEIKLNVTTDKKFDWRTFADTLTWRSDNQIKIDIFDQLKFKWETFSNYCWEMCEE